jgi:hypothetical protein
MSGSRLRPYLGPLVALLVVLALGAGTVYAAIPNGNGTVYACYVKNTGAVRLINYPKVSTCPKGQKLIKWSAQGAQGPAGPQGAQGPQGPAGPADWNAIPNKPAGFADGADNVGYVSTTYPEVHSLTATDAEWVWVETPVGTDVELTLIPMGTTSENVEVFEELYESRAPGLLRHYYHARPWGTGAVDFKVRSRVYNEGIAPAALKKVAKSIKVRVTERGPLKSHG